MAPRSLTPLLALLTLTAVFAPLAGAQESGNTSGAIVVSTAAAAYPPGGAVLFTLNNTGAAELNVTSAKLDIYTAGQVKTSLPVAVGRLAAGGSLRFDWSAFLDGAPAPQGSYFGKLEYTITRYFPNGQPYPWTTSVFVNGRAYGSAEPGWLIQHVANATASGKLAVRVDPAVAAPGQAINITLTNVGTAALTAPNPCQAGFSVRAKDGAILHASIDPTAPCIQQVATLDAGASLAFTWDQRTRSGPAAAGEYRVAGHFGNATSAEAVVTIAAAAPPPPPATGPRGSIAVRFTAYASAPGSPFQFQLVNAGETDLEGTLQVQVRNGMGAVVYAPPMLQVLARLPVGAAMDFTWHQQDDRGKQVPAGKYEVIATFAGLEARTSVEVLAPASPPPPPPGEPAPEKPVVGHIGLDANASLGGEQCYEGTWVAFCLDPAARVLSDFTADGRLVLRAMAVPGTGAINVETKAGAIVLRTTGATITVFDSPAGSLSLASSGAAAGLQLTLGESLRASVGDGNATLHAPGFEALLVVRGEGAVSGSASQLRVDLAPDASGEAGFVLRALPLAVQATAPPPKVAVPDPAQAKVALDAALPQAIAAQKVAAEAYIALEGAEVKTSVVPYIAAEVQVLVTRADAAEVALTVDVSRPEGRTLVFHLGEGILAGARGGFEVRYDGAVIAMADNLADVLDPDDDGAVAEFVLVQGSAGIDLVVSVPHFSAHTITVQGLAEVLPSLAPYGALGGFALMAVAAVYLLRRAKD